MNELVSFILKLLGVPMRNTHRPKFVRIVETFKNSVSTKTGIMISFTSYEDHGKNSQNNELKGENRLQRRWSQFFAMRVG